MNSEESYIELQEEDRDTFFFDTYAFFEILAGNKDYDKYIEAKIITTKLNIFELYLLIYRDISEEKAEEVFKKYYPFVEDFGEIVIKEAAKMKKEFNKRDLSMADCIGYCMAKQLGIKFLTGDEQFEKMENVEYVK